jgi:hypothetical protein
MKMESCLRLFIQEMRLALFLAPASEGNSNEARIAIIAMTTRSSISVKADLDREGLIPGLPRIMGDT